MHFSSHFSLLPFSCAEPVTVLWESTHLWIPGEGEPSVDGRWSCYELFTLSLSCNYILGNALLLKRKKNQKQMLIFWYFWNITSERHSLPNAALWEMTLLMYNDNKNKKNAGSQSNSHLEGLWHELWEGDFLSYTHKF